MKLINTLFFSTAIIALLGASACTQEYSCQCTIKYSGAVGLPDSAKTGYPITNTKKKAKSACEAKSATYDKDGIKTIETCVLN